MGKLLKILIGILISIVILFATVIVSIVTLVDPNQYKNTILAVIKKQTGSEFTMGNVKWGLVGSTLGLIINDVSLVTNPEINRSPIFTINRMELGLNLLPLLDKKVSINKMFIDNGKISLVSNGIQNNWSFPLNNKLDNVNYSLDLHEIKITNTSFAYTNFANNLAIGLQSINLTLSPTTIGSINYYSQSNLLSLNKVKFSLNNIVTGTLDLSYADNLFNLNYVTDSFSLIPLANSVGIDNLPKIFSSKQLQQMKVSSNISGTDKNLNISSIQITTPDSQIMAKATVNSFNPISGYNSIQINHLDIADYIDLNGYRLKASNLTSQGNFVERDKQIYADQDLAIQNLILYGYNLHNLSVKIATILSNPVKIISVPLTITQIQNSIAAANTKGQKNLAITSTLGHLTSKVTYTGKTIENHNLVLSGPDLRANANGKLDINKNYMNYQVNAQFVADPNSLTGKIIYPATISGRPDSPDDSIDWTSVNKQIVQNLGGSLIQTGKDVGKATDSTVKKISNKIKSWF
ncbi:AsmA family protein [Aquella oligotrophica]|uniref:AsmA domain-containing protein n=1 Tax=Aquella oligotrophica TaxID=2067065 RepID=A0A2I7N5Y5_9NEIS|nr:AsmA family protein [Aquella oligotrophica]AUR51841.1 hypothetical protein CUN60_05860 [Aquella oligotrophica]